MPRGTQRGKVAAIGWQRVTRASVDHVTTSLTYPNAAAWNAAWTAHPAFVDVNTLGIRFGAAGADSVDLAMFTGDTIPGTAYYEKSIGGLVAGATYDVLIRVMKLGGFNDLYGALNVAEIGGTLVGAGIPPFIAATLKQRVSADDSGEVAVKLGYWGLHDPGLAEANGTLRVYDGIEFRALAATSEDKLLYLRLDAALTWPAPREGGRNRRSDGGLGALYELPGVDYFLSGTARRIPQVAPSGGVMDDGATITGWDDDDGWQDFLVAARDKRVLTFYPDASDLETGISCYLAEPLQGRPDPDGPGYYQLPFKLVAASPFDGY